MAEFAESEIKLAERLEAGRQAEAEYLRSKFSKYGGSRGTFLSIWLKNTVCNFDGHKPGAKVKAHHIPTCDLCAFMVFRDDKLYPGHSYPKQQRCTRGPDCYTYRMSPQVSQGMRELASAIEREGDIPVSQSDRPDFYIYGHQSGEPVIASQDRREREYAQRMARDDAKKGKVSDG